ncbi:acyl-CoA thioesterase [Psychrobacter sp.]|uniref:acyl-CoA thioesterase n=1 Tax=Psychrobacter sp. TaxID=56811 RepID=UPI0026488EC4|nr:acyl-CoA thioesterase [Psychrobacter sp.]MDN6276580.1 acyl-CoA thioesterase [Psychrobacter sp.]MDN6308683.1 acyl-CoA thioesterase [Psychrobacter sp.]
MNMLIRFFIMVNLLKQQLKQQSVSEHLAIETLTTPTVRSYRILPHDMGFRHHLPNYRYLSFIELNITQWLMTCCHQKGIKNLGWVIAMQEMVYLKEIKFLDKMSVNSKLVGWDKKYIYFETRFFVKHQLMGVGMTKFVLINGKGKCVPEVLDMMDEQLSDAIESWNKHQVAVKSA